MTPEQKAFYDYGRATMELHFVIIRIRSAASEVFGEQYRRLINRERQYLVEDFFLSEYIEDVRRKRAVCRAWEEKGKRYCGNCEYLGLSTKADPYRNCRPLVYQSLWEPRKEDGQ